MTDGAAGDVVELSNTWAVGPQADEVPAVLACAGFEPVGPHVVWVREP